MTNFFVLTQCYFGVYFPSCEATREINTKITLSWRQKQFATRVHKSFSIYQIPTVKHVLRQHLYQHILNYNLSTLKTLSFKHLALRKMSSVLRNVAERKRSLKLSFNSSFQHIIKESLCECYDHLSYFHPKLCVYKTILEYRIWLMTTWAQVR